MKDIATALAAPFAPEAISWRVGSTTQDKSKGMALAYIDSRDVMRRFDEVCGPFGWQSEHIVAADGKKVTCRIGVKNPETGEWVWKSDGAGETDVEGEKGSYSDSLKRAAVVWAVGRYLYDIESPWVKLKPAGRSFAIDDSELPKLRAVLARQAPIAKQAPAPPPERVYSTSEATDGMKIEAEKVVKRLKDARDVFILDQVMDEHRDTVKVLPAATQTYISDLFNKRRRAMMEAV